jgi:5-methylcytosine-specific restriction endonuclease McrA
MLIYVVLIAGVLFFVFVSIASGIQSAKNAATRRRAEPLVSEARALLQDAVSRRYPSIPWDFRAAGVSPVGGSLDAPAECRAALRLSAAVLTEQHRTYAWNPPGYQAPVTAVGPQTGGHPLPPPHDWPRRRESVWARDNGRCQRCGLEVSLNEAHIHHILRRAHGGGHDEENLITLCRDCHALREDGHDELRRFAQFVASGGFLHSPGCRTLGHGRHRGHGVRGQVIWGSPAKLMAKHNLRPCRYCDPRSYYQGELRKWTPDFGLWISREADIACASVCNQRGYLAPPIGPPPKLYRERVEEKREKRARQKEAAAERAVTAATIAQEQEGARIREIERCAEAIYGQVATYSHKM